MCFESIVVKDCGASGFCSEQDICICSPGWSQSLEMVYFPFTKEHESNETFVLETLPCSIHDNLLYSIFLISFVLNIVELVHVGRKLTTLKRLQRQLPLTLALIFDVVCYGIRLGDPSQEYSISKSYTYTLGLAFAFHQVSTTIFLSKFIRYHLYKMKSGLGTELKLFRRDVNTQLRYIIPFLFCHDLIGLFVFIAPAYLNRRQGGAFFYFHYVKEILRAFLLYYLVRKTLLALISDMKSVVLYTTENNTTNSFYLYCLKAIPNITSIIRIVASYSYIVGLAVFLPLCFPSMEFISVYVHAFIGGAFAAMSFGIGYIFQRNLNFKLKIKSGENKNHDVLKTGDVSI
eukprot:snap_masked-scaffold_39-processed-gene-2.43-mRNA-1 protein AED:1.00 eAED:1.00 QI:0/-1/0/0/-1/1/1/0/345